MERSARAREEELAGVELASLRALVNCSEPVTHESHQRFLGRFSPRGLTPDAFTGCYAMAETTFALTHGRSGAPDCLDAHGPVNAATGGAATGGAATGGAGLPAVSVGQPLRGVELEVVDDDGHPLPERRLGELRVCRPFNFGGYYNNPQATAEVLRDGWYYTGDLGYRVGRELFVTCRKKELFIVGGVNVWPQDLESVATVVEGLHPGRAVAFAEFDAARQTEKVVVLCETDAVPAQQRGLVLAVRQRILAALQLADFEVHLVPPGWLVKSSSGKLARRENQARWSQHPPPTGVRVARDEGAQRCSAAEV